MTLLRSNAARAVATADPNKRSGLVTYKNHFWCWQILSFGYAKHWAIGYMGLEVSLRHRHATPNIGRLVSFRRW